MSKPDQTSEQPAKTQLTPQWQRWGSGLFVAAVFIALALRQHLFVDRYAVNILFWDQWDFYAPLFNGGSLWDIFNQQHGPHRQGLGFLLTKVLAELSHWNSRWDAFGVSFVLIAAAALGIALARKCGARGVALATVPLLFLNIRQYEIFVHASNISHGAMPIFLLMATLLCFFIKRNPPRLAAISILTFLSLYTGFGIFVAVVIPIVLLLELYQYWKKNEKRSALLVLTALLTLGAAWRLFSVGYQFAPAVSDYRFPYEKPWQYFYFVAAMLNNFHGFKTDTLINLVFGLGAEALLLWVASIHGKRVLQRGVCEERKSVIIFSLAGFALIYGFSTAVGRVFLGWQDAGGSSRYVTLMMPACFAFYLHCSTLKNERLAKISATAYALLLAYNTVELHTRDIKNVESISNGRTAWKAAYLETHSETQANEISHFSIFPAPVLHERLQYLEEHKLNLFTPTKRP